MPGKIEELNEKDFAKAVRENTTVVIFWAPWCHACHATLPIVEELATKLKNQATFFKTNVVENPGLSSRYGVMSLPNILMFKKGKIAEQIIGATDKITIEKSLQKLV